MPVTHALKIHNGKVLWPAHKPLSEVLELKRTTIPHVWETTYQNNPTDPAGQIFRREWWMGQSRYSHEETIVARWISADTALSDEDTAAKSAMVVGELLADYRMRIRDVWSGHVQFPQLVDQTRNMAYRYNYDNLLHGVIIEDKASGISLVQTIRQAVGSGISDKIITFNPRYSKEMRWNQAAVWCANGCILLPEPSPDFPWLYDFESSLYEAPAVVYKDTLDAFAQLILYTELYLSEGYNARHPNGG